MEAIILAGGFGTRLRPLTYTRAKALLPILNKPMVSYIINLLPDCVDTVILAVNYRKDQLEHYFDIQDFGKRIIVNDEPQPLGTGGAVKFAQQLITGSFFVINADVICSLNLGKMIQYHTKKHAQATISLWPVENVSEFGVVDITKEGNITNFVEKPKPEDAPSDLINAGAYLLEPEVLDYIEPGRLISMEKEIFPRIIKDTGLFYGYQFKGYWIDVGRFRSYHDVHQLLLAKQKKNNIIGNECSLHGTLSKSCVGDNVIIQDHANLKSTIVFNHASIGTQVVLDRCVIGENCRIGENSNLSNTVVGDNEQIPPNTHLENTVVWTQPTPPGYPQKQIGNVLGE